MIKKKQMKKIFLLLVLALALTQTHAQFVHKIKADSVLITNDSCTAELNLENSTKNVKGFLYNKGNGRTEFRKMVKSNDSTFIMGDDTLSTVGTFVNGLTRTGNTVKLGGALTQPTTITTSGSNPLTITGFSGGSNPNPLFNITNTAAAPNYGGTALSINGGTGAGLFISNTDIGMQYSGNGSGLYATSFGSVAASIESQASTAAWFFRTSGTSNLQEVIGIRRQSWGTVTNGIGGMISYYTQTSDGFINRVSTQLESSWVNAADSARSALFTITLPFPGTNSRSEVSKFFSPGNVQFPKYTGTTFTVSDTATYKPMVMDASGNIRKFNSWVGGGSSSLTLQQVTTNGNTTTNPIKPSPGALPTGSNNDSIVVWSSADSLLKRVAPKQTFAQTATATVTGTNDESTLISSGTGSLTIPASAWVVGKTYKIVVRGVWSTDANNPAGINIKLKLGSTVIAQSSNMFLGTGKSNVPYEVRAEFTCRSTGASGTIFTMGLVYADDAFVNKFDNGTTTSTINLTGNQTLDVTATLSDDAAGNSISSFIVFFEAAN
jgi:hypothetical protein